MLLLWSLTTNGRHSLCRQITADCGSASSCSHLTLTKKTWSSKTLILELWGTEVLTVKQHLKNFYFLRNEPCGYRPSVCTLFPHVQLFLSIKLAWLHYTGQVQYMQERAEACSPCCVLHVGRFCWSLLNMWGLGKPHFAFTVRDQLSDVCQRYVCRFPAHDPAEESYFTTTTFFIFNGICCWFSNQQKHKSPETTAVLSSQRQCVFAWSAYALHSLLSKRVTRWCSWCISHPQSSTWYNQGGGAAQMKSPANVVFFYFLQWNLRSIFLKLWCVHVDGF